MFEFYLKLSGPRRISRDETDRPHRICLGVEPKLGSPAGGAIEECIGQALCICATGSLSSKL